MNYFLDLITSNYLVTCSLLFFILSIPKKHRKEWLTLAALSFLLYVNKVCFDRNGGILYYVRGFITTISAIYLMTRLTAMGFYQGLILLLMVTVYLMLAYDVTQGQHVLIYNNYEAAIYGLVFCQFLGVFPVIRNINSVINSGCNTNTYNHKDGESI